MGRVAGLPGAPGGGERRRGLDPVSSRILVGWLVRACVLAGCAFLPCCLGWGSLADTGGTLSLLFSLGGLAAMLTASCRQDRAGRGSLNGWDEALAFNGLSLLLHLLLLTR